MIAYFKRKWTEWKDEKQRRLDEIDRTIWRSYYASQNFNDVSTMSGRQFEEFLARLFEFMGYSDIRLTPATDQGGDIVCISRTGVPTVIQAKRWSGPVGNGAVQEALGAMRHYGCEEGIVVTNSRFTSAAAKLVEACTDVTLCDKQWLEERVREYFPNSVPEFSRDRFEKIIEGWVQTTRRIAAQTTRPRKRFPRGHYTFTEALRYAAEAKGKELTVSEIKKLAQLHANWSDADANLRKINRELEGARERRRRLEAELGELDEALMEAESSEWMDDYKGR